MAEGEPIIVQTPVVETSPVEKGGENREQVQAPAFDMSAFTQGIKETIQGSFQDIARSVVQPPVQQPVVQTAVDPLAQTLNPYFQPLDVKATGAYDASTFYPLNPEATKYGNQIEALARQHPTTPRVILWQYVRGSDEYISAQRQAALDEQSRAAEAVANAGTLGVGSPNRSIGPVRQASEMPQDELSKALEGFAF